MAFCTNCGQEIGQSAYCPNCGAPQGVQPNAQPGPTQSDPVFVNAEPVNPGQPYDQQFNQQYNQTAGQQYGQYNQQYAPVVDSGSFGWAVLGFFFPIVGLILYLVWKDTKPKSAKQAGMGALVSVIINVVLVIISTCAGAVFVGVNGSV